MALPVFQVRNTIVRVEYPLVKDQLEEIDRVLEQAEEELCWRSDGELHSSMHDCRLTSCRHESGSNRAHSVYRQRYHVGYCSELVSVFSIVKYCMVKNALNTNLSF